MLFRYAINVGRLLLFLFAPLLVLLAASYAYAEEMPHGELCFNQDSVAILANTTFSIRNLGNNAIEVSVPDNDWSRAAMKTTRDYIVFSESGVCLPVGNPQLGKADVEESGQCILRLGTAAMASGKQTIVFSGQAVGLADLQEIFTASGPIGGNVTDQDMRAALNGATFGNDEVDAAVVDMPDLNSRTADTWANGLSGKLGMVLFVPDAGVRTETAAGVEADAPPASWVSDSDVELSMLEFELDKYKGFYPDIKPLGDVEHVSYADFSSTLFRDSWMVDGDGYLWYVDSSGEQYYFVDSFYSIVEHVYNTEAISVLSKQGEGVARAMKDPSSVWMEEGFSISPSIAFQHRGFKITGYLSFSVESISLDLEEMVLTHTESSSLHIVSSYGSSYETAMYFNYCLNKSIPVTVHVGPLVLSLYFSLGANLDASSFSYSFDASNRASSKIDLETGESLVLDQQHSESCSLSLGAAAHLECFVSCAVSLTHFITLASFDFCPVALEMRVYGLFTAGGGSRTDNKGDSFSNANKRYLCGELGVEAYGHVQVPSIYDRGVGGQPSESLFEPNIYSFAYNLVGYGGMRLEFYRVNLFSCHIEDGKRVNHCTRGEGFDDGSRVITKEMCSFAKWQDLVVKAGSGYHPKVVVKKTAYGPNDTLVEGRDYTVAYDDFKRAGVGIATVKGKGEWAGEVVLEYTVEREDISLETLTADPASYTFTGSPVKPKAIKRSGKVLKQGVDYQVLEIANNVNAGTATMMIKGIGLYTGTARVVFAIAQATMNQVAIEGVIDKVYSGEPQQQEAVLKLGKYKLKPGVDYTVEYRNNTNAGAAIAVFRGKGNFKGATQASFEIARAPIPLPAPGKQLVFNGQHQAGYVPGSQVDYVYLMQAGTLFATSVGTYSSQAVAAPNYIFENGETTHWIDWSISSAPMSSVDIKAIPDKTYTGSPVKPGTIITLQGTTLSAKGNYKVSYSNNVSAGTATVTYTGVGNLTGSRSVTFKILPKSIGGASVEVAMQTYTGKPLKPDPVVKMGTTVLKKGVDYTVSYKNNTNAGTATVTIAGKGNYKGSKSAKFKISPQALSGAVVASVVDQPFTGGAIKPAPQVSVDGVVLAKDADYSLSYSDNVKVGTASITVTGKGNYAGTVASSFKIVRASIASATVASIPSKVYTGAAITPAPVVKKGAKTLAKDTDYTLSYKNNVNAGTATVTITGKGNYKGTKSVTFQVVPASIANASAAAIGNQTYTGKAITPSPTVKLGSKM